MSNGYSRGGSMWPEEPDNRGFALLGHRFPQPLKRRWSEMCREMFSMSDGAGSPPVRSPMLREPYARGLPKISSIVCARSGTQLHEFDRRRYRGRIAFDVQFAELARTAFD